MPGFAASPLEAEPASTHSRSPARAGKPSGYLIGGGE
jgi:hypothetical protein